MKIDNTLQKNQMECHMLTNKSTIYNEVVNIDFYTLVKIGNNDK